MGRGEPTFDGGRLIRNIPLLARLADDDIRALARSGATRAYGPGRVIFREGDPGDALHVVVDGEVRVGVLSGSGGQATIDRFGPGDCFGELALLDGRPRSATATAATATRTFVVPRVAFLAWLRERPDAAFAMLETLSVRLRRTSERMTDQIFLSLPQRIAKHLLSSGAAEPSHSPAAVEITQGELGTLLGVSRESVNKALRNLERAGLIRLGRGRIVIPDPLALRRSL